MARRSLRSTELPFTSEAHDGDATLGESDRVEVVDEDDDGGIVVRLPAVLDIFSAGPLRICIHELLADGHRRLRLDMAEVIVIEAEGLEMLEEARATAGELDAQVDFIQPSKDISNVLDLAGMEKRAPRDPSGREHPSRQGRER